MPLGFVASSVGTQSSNSVPVRTISAAGSSGTTLVATFTEGTALDSTHLLVATAWVGTATVATAPGGWTAVTGSGNNSGVQVRMWVKQGDGSTNSFTLTKNSGTGSGITLLAFAGYSSTTPLLSNGQSTAAATSATITPSSTPAGQGVAILATATTAAAAPYTGWSNGYTVPVTMSAPATGFQVAIKAYTSASGTYNSTVTWTNSALSRQMYALMPLL